MCVGSIRETLRRGKERNVSGGGKSYRMLIYSFMCTDDLLTMGLLPCKPAIKKNTVKTKSDLLHLA